MQIVIPMSGFGERFRRAGYTKPKPLIQVDGKPIIAHVIDLFPGETDFIFICNEDHLAEPSYNMAKTLRQYCPEAKIVPIKPHKLGPVNAVLEAREHIDLNQPTIVNYCDFTCYWNYKDFKSFVREVNCAGAIPAYTGFHPHSLGSTFYAYMRHSDLWMTDIQEKQPFTNAPMTEYASSGTYYFKSGAICLDAFDRQIDAGLDINGEYYASLAYKILLSDRQKVAVYDVQHFMQWGTPTDLVEYQNWSDTFKKMIEPFRGAVRHDGVVLVPMAGLGSRFVKEGYSLPKPLIPVSGRAMVLQAVRDLPNATQYRFVTRKDLPLLEETNRALRSSFLDTHITILDGVTEGQAISCREGLIGVDLDKPLTIGACDNGLIYDSSALDRVLKDRSIDVLVWTVKGHPDGISRPEMFGWVQADEDDIISAVSVKKALKEPSTDHMITGAFTFRKAKFYFDALESLIDRGFRVNGELYVDSLIEDAVSLGLKCHVFEVDAYTGWGTPKDLKIFEYWQSCFHKWSSHPYRLEKDPRVPTAGLEDLKTKYSETTAPRPY